MRDRVGTVTGQVYNGQFLLDRAQFVGQPIHRVDMRLQKRFSLGGRRNADLMAEVFNIFNHANYGSYTTTFSNAAQYGLPSQNTATAYLPRIVQLGFHLGVLGTSAGSAARGPNDSGPGLRVAVRGAQMSAARLLLLQFGPALFP